MIESKMISDFMFGQPLEKIERMYEIDGTKWTQSIIDQRMRWSENGLCNHCGGTLVVENNGFSSPDPIHEEMFCSNNYCPSH